MKLENTLANKMKFIALYWGQSVRLYKDDSVSKSTIKTWDLEHPEDVFLELTPLSQITDEDAIEVAKLIGYAGSDKESISYLNSQCKSIIKEHGVFWLLNLYRIDSQKCLLIFDFLHSKGYYIGDGTEIEYGWVKLKEA